MLKYFKFFWKTLYVSVPYLPLYAKNRTLWLLKNMESELLQ